VVFGLAIVMGLVAAAASLVRNRRPAAPTTVDSEEAATVGSPRTGGVTART
jgi:hypothetical protein